MAYNGYGYSNYPPNYYSSQTPDQHQNQQSTSSSQAYQNPYSPYYQSTGQYAQQSSERGQQYQTKSEIDNSSFQSSFYPQAQYQPASGTNNAAAYSQPQAYQSATQPTTSGYGYANQTSSDQNTRSYTDNSALGNLAYASTLGRNSPAAGQSTSSSRQQTSLPAYQMAQNPTSYQQQQPMTQDAAAQPRRTKTPASYTPAQEAVRQSQVKQPSPQLSAQPSHRSGHSSSSRPASAMSQQNTRSPAIPNKPKSGQQYNANASSAQQPTSSTQPSGKASRNAGKSSKAHQISTIMNQSEPTSAHSARQNANQGATRNHGNFSQGSTPVITSPITANEVQPTTIDPSQIFDQAEFQRRKKAAEDAEAAKRATKNKAQSKTQQSKPQQPQQPAQATQPQTPTLDQSQSNHARTESQSREQIQAEMKTMIEKMREYKSKDPSGFTEMWEQFKKVQPPPARVASQTPQMGKASVPPTTGSSGEAVFSPSTDNASFPSPVLREAQDVLGEASSKVPDLGKFPAMRRRTRNDKGSSRHSRDGETATSKDDLQPEKATKSKSQKSNTTPKTRAPGTDAGADTMRRAMQAFHNTPTPTPSSKQSSPPSQSPRPTIWPEEKKGHLAEVAKKFLEGLDINKGKIITVAEVHMMLNQNPSYDQLCNMLNNRGFQFSRAPFAQTLLSIVPTSSPGESPKRPRGRPRKDSGGVGTANGQGSQSKSSYNVKWRSTLTKAGYPSEKDDQSSSTARTANVISHGLPILNGPTNVAPEYKNYYERMRMISSGSPPGPPSSLSKQQAAKKRNFSEIVDLSQMSDGDESQAKKSKGPRGGGDHAGKEQALPPNIHSDLVLTDSGLNQNDSNIPIDPLLSQSSQPPHVTTGGPSTDSHQGRFDSYRAKNGTISSQEQLRNANLVQPINIVDALRYRPINVSTLARDILISKGEHPSERPLNFHLRDLALNFKSVTTKSDLSTFRWDLVDPGGPPPGTIIPSLEGEYDSEDPEDNAFSSHNATAESNRIDAAAHSDPQKKFDSILTRGRGRGRGRGRPRVRGAIFASRFYEGAAQNQAPKSVRGSFALVSRGRVRARGASRAVESSTPISTDKTPATFSDHQPGTPALRNETSEPAKDENPISNAPLSINTVTHPDSMDIDSPSDTQDEVVQESPKRSLMVAASADVMQEPPNLIDQLPMSSPGTLRISSQSLNPTQQAQKKRRGRPPKSGDSLSPSTPSSLPLTVKERGHLLKVRDSLLPSITSETSSVASRDTESRRGRPPKARESLPSTPSNASPAASQDVESGSQSRKRGRPPGAKNKLKPTPSSSIRAVSRPRTPVDGIGIMVPAPSSAMKASPLAYGELQKEYTSPSWKAVNKYAEENPDTDQFASFPCSWGDCDVDLHNFDTLRKHVGKVHISQPQKSFEGGLHCQWTDCQQNDFDFAEPALLEEHVDEHHLSKIASSLGDGPSTHPTGEK